MSFIVTARKWRPLQFKDVVGQEHITLTLKNSIQSDRVHHAYLFSGPRGVGKTTTARILARVINCSNPVDSEPCNVCESCISILEAKSLDVIEIDGASNNSVDDIRKLRENAKYPPSSGNKKMYIIDEVHMLSTAAFNALLKILEEPPSHLMFVFATTEQHKVPATILSRCQRHEFRRIESASIITQLKEIATKELIKVDDDSFVTIANKADGSMRDAQSIFDQVIAFAGTDIHYTQMIEALHLIDEDFFFRISEAGKSSNLNEMFTISREIIIKGYDLQDVLGGLLEHYRNLLTVKVTGNSSLINSSENFLIKYHSHAGDFTKAELLRLLNLISQSEQSIKYASQPKIKFELTLIQIASLESTIEITELINEIRSGAADINASPKSNMAKDVSRHYETTKLPTSSQPTRSAIHTEPKFHTKENKADENWQTPPSLREGWADFLSKYSAKESLTFLKSSGIVFADNEIIVYTETEFICNNLLNKKSTITDRLNEFYGRPVGLKIVYDASRNAVNSYSAETIINKESIANSSQPITDDEKAHLHAVDRFIIEKFGARKINR